jgi:hypothetical protein
MPTIIARKVDRETKRPKRTFMSHEMPLFKGGDLNVERGDATVTCLECEAVLMSLWSVPDQETQELMRLFYEKWLAGKEKHAALREAQLEMRQKVKERYGEDLPFYWGAFVLVGK